LSTHLRLGLHSGLLPSGFPPISYMHSSSTLFVLHAPSISSSFTWRRVQEIKISWNGRTKISV
jgi:hypothetical protein